MLARLTHVFACLAGRHSPGAKLRVDFAPADYLAAHAGAPPRLGWDACLWCGRPKNGTQRYMDFARSGEAWWP